MQQLDYNNARAVFSTWSVPRRYKLNEVWSLVIPVWRRGRIPPTVALRVVGGDEKGSLESETVKYGRESNVTGTRE
jgi:hypothetical protein